MINFDDNPEELCPIKVVSGSNGKLFTGVVYSLFHKETNSPVTYDPKEWSKVKENNVVTRDWKEYKPDGEWRSSTLFVLIEEFSHYVLFHIETSSPMTYVSKKECNNFGANFFVFRNNEQYQKGGNLRNSTYFDIREENNNFILFHKETAAPVSYIKNQEKYENQLVSKNLKGDEHVCQISESFLFSFIPSGCEKIYGSIGDFKYDLPAEDIIMDKKKKIALFEKRIIYNNTKAKITEDFSFSKKFTHLFRIQFMESLKFIDLKEIKAFAPFSNTDLQFFINEYSDQTKQFTKSEIVDFTSKKIIEIPPFTNIEFFGYANWVDFLEVPFTATLKISGIMDRLNKKGSKSSAPINSDYLENLLKQNQVQGEIIKAQENEIMIKIKGKFQGSYSLETVFSLDENKKI